MNTERTNRSATITRTIEREIQTALVSIGANENQLKRIPSMSANALADLAIELEVRNTRRGRRSVRTTSQQFHYT